MRRAKYKIVWTAKARERLREIVAYLQQFSSAAAARIGKQIAAATRRLADFPESGRRVPELPGTHYREVIRGNYRIVYEVAPPRVVRILTIRHGRQAPMTEEDVKGDNADGDGSQ